MTHDEKKKLGRQLDFGPIARLNIQPLGSRCEYLRGIISCRDEPVLDLRAY